MQTEVELLLNNLLGYKVTQRKLDMDWDCVYTGLLSEVLYNEASQSLTHPQKVTTSSSGVIRGSV